MASQNSNYLRPQSNWISQLAVITATRYFHTVASDGINIWVMGGVGPVDTNYMYTMSTNAWSTKAVITAARQAHSATYVAGNIYVIGGVGVSSAYQNTVYQYNTSGNSWATKTSMGANRANHFAIAYGQYIFVIGGYDGTNYFGSVNRYDTVGDSWSTSFNSIPSSYLTSDASGGLVDDNIFIFGGRNAGGTNTASYRYNITTDSWFSLTACPYSLYGSACFTLGKYIYVLGGGTTAVKISLRYNTIMDNWKLLGDLPIASAGGVAGCLVGNKGFIMGGFNGSALNNNNMLLL